MEPLTVSQKIDALNPEPAAARAPSAVPATGAAAVASSRARPTAWN
jgi:hypothetical protein